MNYQSSVPEIAFNNAKGLSDTALKQLHDQLLDKAAHDFAGEEMIFQLCQHVQEFLVLHNKPTSKSFYDEMLQRRREEEQKDLAAKQREMDRQRQLTMEEIQRRQDTLKNAEALSKKQQRYNSEHSTDNDSDFNRQLSISFE